MQFPSQYKLVYGPHLCNESLSFALLQKSTFVTHKVFSRIAIYII